MIEIWIEVDFGHWEFEWETELTSKGLLQGLSLGPEKWAKEVLCSGSWDMISINISFLFLLLLY